MLFKVGGVNYSVVLKEDLVARFELGGQILYPKSEIIIDNGLEKTRRDQYIIHELTHAIFFEAGYKEQEEDMVNRIGNILHQFIQDNDLSVFRRLKGDSND